MDDLISLYIDNELSMEDKIRFVQHIRENASAAEKTIELLNQEQMIRDDVVVRIPRIDFPRMPSWRKLFDFMVRPMSAVAASLAIAVFVLISLVLAPESPDQTNRFVLYRPDIAQVEITGSFTGWRRLPMDQIGQSGYWEIRLPVPRGEHRFSYILDGQYSVADPTILEKELDDFGSVNSLLRVGNEV